MTSDQPVAEATRMKWKAIELPEALKKKIRPCRLSERQMKRTPRSNSYWRGVIKKLRSYGADCPTPGMRLYDFMLLLKSDGWSPTINDVAQMAKQSGFTVDGDPMKPTIAIISRLVTASPP